MNMDEESDKESDVTEESMVQYLDGSIAYLESVG